MTESLSRLVLNLIGPGTIAVFGFGFIGAWLIDRHRPYLLALAAGCLMFGIGMVLQVFRWPSDFAINALASNFFYTGAVLMVAEGLLRRSGDKLELWSGIGILVLTSGLIAFYCYVERSVIARIYIQNFGFGAILLLTAVQLRALARGRLIDRILFWTLLVFAIQFFPRTLLTAGGAALDGDPAGFGRTFFWQALQLSMAVLGAALALTMLIAALFDIIDDIRQERDMDGLTGVRNRRGFEERAETLLRSAGETLPVLILADLDHFKQVNDSFGHAVGDAVLRSFGTMLTQHIGADAVFRIGGEEFAILLPEGGQAAAGALVATLQGAIASTKFGLPDPAARTTASFGAAVARDSDRLQSWFERADRALYAAKHGGRDRVVFAGDAAGPAVNA